MASMPPTTTYPFIGEARAPLQQLMPKSGIRMKDEIQFEIAEDTFAIHGQYQRLGPLLVHASQVFLGIGMFLSFLLIDLSVNRLLVVGWTVILSVNTWRFVRIAVLPSDCEHLILWKDVVKIESRTGLFRQPSVAIRGPHDHFLFHLIPECGVETFLKALPPVAQSKIVRLS